MEDKKASAGKMRYIAILAKECGYKGNDYDDANLSDKGASQVIGQLKLKRKEMPVCSSTKQRTSQLVLW